MTDNVVEKIFRWERDYVKLEDGDGDGKVISEAGSPRHSRGWRWGKLILAAFFCAVLLFVFFKWVAPFVMNKAIIPMIKWVETFGKTELGVIIFSTLAIFPTLLLPSSPSMWLAGITFGYGYGFLLTIVAVSIGVSFPYFIGSVFYRKIQVWLDAYPKKASVIRLAGEGGFCHQFQAVTLIRITPFPYIIYNYCAVATDVKYWPYLFGTLVGMVPEIFLTLYTGILIQTLANASGNEALSSTQISCTVAGFCLTVAATIVVTFYANKRLTQLQMEEGLLHNTDDNANTDD